MSDTIGMTVYEKLRKVQQELKVPKSQYNSFGKYYYRNCEDIQEAVKPLLQDVNAVLFLDDEIEQKGDRYYVKAIAKFVDCDTGKEIVNKAYAREEEEKKGMDASQITGSTSSYARKYALNGLFCIDDNKDADSNGKINEDQRNEIIKELKRTGVGIKRILENYGLKTLEEMEIDQFKEAVKVLKSKPDKEKIPPPVSDNEMKQLSPPDDNGLPFN